MADAPRPFTVPQFAERWQCSKSDIYKMIADVHLAAFRFGGRSVRITADVLRNGLSIRPGSHVFNPQLASVASNDLDQDLLPIREP